MPQPGFVEKLTEQALPIDRILLDPNNPRLMGLEGYEGVEESRIAEPGVQSSTIERLNSHRAFDQEGLRASIEQTGLLPVDRIVVRPLPKSDENEQLFVVVEGNRRIAACKTLLELDHRGEKTLDADIRKSIEQPRVLILPEVDVDEARLDQWLIQGVRHISGIRPWGGYQAAKSIEAMVERLGYSEADVAGALSISLQRVRRSIRVLSALKQMSESEDFGTYAGPDYYAYFDEVLKRPAVRQWLEWSDESKRFENDERFELFLTWIAPDDELNGRARIPVAESVRRLDQILGDKAALDVMNTPGATVDDAARVALPQAGPDWREPLERAIKALDNVPISDLESLDADNRTLIENLLELAKRRLEQADSFAK